LLAHEPHGFGGSAVVAHHEAVISIKPAVIQQIYGETYIRSLLLGLEKLQGLNPSKYAKVRGGVRPISDGLRRGPAVEIARGVLQYMAKTGNAGQLSPLRSLEAHTRRELKERLVRRTNEGRIVE